jgi:uncharacterized phosphosugar-binding protein
MESALAYLDAVENIVARIRDTQTENIAAAAEICATTIAAGGLVHLFGCGHSRISVEEMFPRHGSFPGFHPIVELSLTFHNPVVGANGQRQAMFLEHVEGFAPIIMRNFVFAEPDSFIIFSNSGINEVVVDVALEATKRGMPLIAVVSMDHCVNTRPKHSSGKRLPEIADITIDNCAPAGDAMVAIDGMSDPVGPGSTIGAVIVANALKCRVAEKLSALGHPPKVLTSSFFLGEEASAQRFDEVYDDYRTRVRRVFGCER